MDAEFDCIACNAKRIVIGVTPVARGYEMRPAHKQAAMIFGDMARDVAAQLNETPEWRMDVSDESGKSLFRVRLLTEPLD